MMRPRTKQQGLQVAAACALVVLGVWYFTSGGSSPAGTIAGSADPRGRYLLPEEEHMHVLVTGGAGFIGSHASMRLLEEGHAVTVVDNFSRGNPGAIKVLEDEAKPGRFHFAEVDLGDKPSLIKVFRESNIDLVIHFAAVAYVGESMAEPLRYYHNITANTVNVLEAMQDQGVNKLVFSSTCAVYGNAEVLPITEQTPTIPINPYGKAKLMAETEIKDYAAANSDLEVVILRYFNVYGSDKEGRLGEYPRPDLRHHGRIGGACMDAALGEIPSLKIMGTNHPTEDGTCVRDYIHVLDLVDAHVKGIGHLSNPPQLFNVGTGNGVSVRQFVNACLDVTGAPIEVVEQPEARPGDYAAVFADVTKINSVMGWYAQYTDPVESLGHMWKWRQNNPNGYPEGQP